MKPFDGVHNSMVIGAYEILTTSQSLDDAAQALDGAKGSISA